MSGSMSTARQSIAHAPLVIRPRCRTRCRDHVEAAWSLPSHSKQMGCAKMPNQTLQIKLDGEIDVWQHWLRGPDSKTTVNAI